MARLFGTDGVREIANTRLSPELAFVLGRVGTGIIARRLGTRPTVIVGRDTRLSGDMLEAAVVAGIASVGGICSEYRYSIPTPRSGVPGEGIFKLMQASSFQLLIIPWSIHGIKFISGDGFKLSDKEELEIEKHVISHEKGRLCFDTSDVFPRPSGNDVGRVFQLEDAGERYIRHAKSTVRCYYGGV